jgi:hypothetical protein
MTNLREHMKEYPPEHQEVPPDGSGIKGEQAGSRSVQYYGYLIGYTTGGFIISFHLLICVSPMPRLIWHYYYAFRETFKFVSNILILYALQSLSILSISKFVDTRWTCFQNSRLKQKLENILQYFMVVASKSHSFSMSQKILLSSLYIDCFISITRSIVRLFTGFFSNLANINRVDLYYTGETFKNPGETSVGYVLQQKEDEISKNSSFELGKSTRR